MRSFLFAILALAFTGCAGYKLGPTNGQTAGSHSISIAPFRNETIEPRLIEYVSNALRKHVQQDGTYTLETHGDGDLVMKGKITKYFRSELSVLPTDVITPRDYILILTAEITVTDASTGKVVMRRDVTGRTDVHVGTDLSNAERQAAPLLADDLARNAISVLANPAW